MMLLIAAPSGHAAAVWAISLGVIALILIRPKGLPEAWWAAAGACLLVLTGLLPARSALKAVGKGVDVYLFLIGMMIMSELARREGVFDWVACHAVQASKGSRTRLFALIYGVGVAVTVFLSNDATAVVLTPAVLAAVRTAEAEPLPYLMACAFVANAASFVLPISNPANLVVYAKDMPPLGEWLVTFGFPSVAAILLTLAALRWLSRKDLQGKVKSDVEGATLKSSGKLTVWGIGLLAVTLMTASAFHLDLGAPACAAGLLVAVVISLRDHAAPKDIAKEISWSVLPLVAGLFVVIEAVDGAGALSLASGALRQMKSWPPLHAALASGFGVALLSNVVNNLPSGLISGAAVQAAGVKGMLRDALLIGVDLGPNLSVTGSLATILWLIALRREGQNVGFWPFLKWGALVMPPALLLAIAALGLGGSR